MSDIVERLRQVKTIFWGGANVPGGVSKAHPELLEAANVIESLRQQLTERERLLAESQAREKALRDGLSQAAEDVAGWGALVSEYFQDKWNLVGDVKRAQHLASMPSDSTALDTMLAQHLAKAKREVFMLCKDRYQDFETTFGFELWCKRMADEVGQAHRDLKGGEQ